MDYDSVIRSVIESEVKNAAVPYSVDQFRLQRSLLEKYFHRRLRNRLEGEKTHLIKDREIIVICYVCQHRSYNFAIELSYIVLVQTCMHTNLNLFVLYRSACIKWNCQVFTFANVLNCLHSTTVSILVLCVLHQETAALPVAPAAVTTSQPAPCVHRPAPVTRDSTSMWSIYTLDRWISQPRSQRGISPGLC